MGQAAALGDKGIEKDRDGDPPMGEAHHRVPEAGSFGGFRLRVGYPKAGNNDLGDDPGGSHLILRL